MLPTHVNPPSCFQLRNLVICIALFDRSPGINLSAGLAFVRRLVRGQPDCRRSGATATRLQFGERISQSSCDARQINGSGPLGSLTLELTKVMSASLGRAPAIVSLILATLLVGFSAPGRHRTPSPKRKRHHSSTVASVPARRRSMTPSEEARTAAAERDRDLRRSDQPSEGEEFFLLKRLAAGEKSLSFDRYLKAKQQIQGMRRYSTALNSFLPENSGLTDAELDSLGNWMQLGPGNVGGRTRALVIAPSNPNTMFAAGVAGGVWKTTNGGTSWSAIGDILPNLAISTLAVDPLNPNIIYAGSGEGFFNFDAQRGAGIFKSVDGGASWGLIASPVDYFGFDYINKIIISPNNHERLYAGTRSGVWLSVDGGSTWTAVFLPTANGGCVDLAIRSDRSTDYVFAAIGTFTHSFVATNTDAAGSGTWIADGLPDFFGLGRISLALAPSNQNIVYALASEYFNVFTDPQGPGPFQYGLHALYRSTDGGVNWTTRVSNTSGIKLNRVLLSNPLYDFLTECGFPGPDVLLNQGWYDNVIAVDPADPNRVWVGGIDLLRSDDGGVNWGLGSFWWGGTTDPHFVHADQHAIVFHPQYNGSTNQVMFVANDGGIFRTNNARASVATAALGGTAACNTANTSVTWSRLNNTYGVPQFSFGLPYPDDTAYFGGTQDNGTIRGADATGINAWSTILGGDGGSVAIDRNNTSVLYAENTGLSIQKSTNAGASFASAITGITESPSKFLFISPFTMDPSNSQRLWTGGMQLWRTVDGAAHWVQATDAEYTFSPYSSIAVAPTNPNCLAAGSSDGYVISTTSALTADSSQHFLWTQRIIRDGYVSSVAYDPIHPSIIYATYSSFNTQITDNHVYRSTDSGFSWTGIDGTPGTRLPDIPVHSIVVDPAATTHLYIGTDLGVFVSLDWGQSWARENSGFTDVITESLAMNSFSGTNSLYGFTHGRGAWRVKVPDNCATLSLAGQAFTPAGGTGSVNVTATGGCAWTAVSNDSWITITSGSSGFGNGTVNFTVAANATLPQPISRVGTMVIAQQIFLVTQDGDNCTVSLTVSSPYLTPSAGTGTFDANANGGCALRSMSNDSWITITSPKTGPNGFLTVNYSYTANPGTAIRTGSITVFGPYSSTTCFIRQAGQGCTFSISPQSISVDGTTLNTGTINVTATAGCAWTATTTDSWITINSGASGTGNGLVSYAIALNNSPDSRLGHIIVAAHDFIVFQFGGFCSQFVVTPTSFSFDQYGGSGVVSVTTPANCQWGIVNNSFWITTTSPSPLLGTGKISFKVARNTSGVPRTDTVNVAGQDITISQDGNSCLMSLSPTSQFFSSTGGSGNLTVSGPAVCAWSAVSNAPWITVDSGVSGSGPGSVAFSVAGNLTGNERTGSLTVAGVSFVITQSGCAVAIAPNGVSVGANSTSGTIGVTTTNGCAWDAQTSTPWITIFAGQSGSGNGSVLYSVGANNGLARTGQITVAGQSFTVAQLAGPPTAASLKSFGATVNGSDAVLEWHTGLEVGNLGFNLYRDDGKGRLKINHHLIAGSALLAGPTPLASGRSYRWMDQLAQPDRPAQYWLEDVNLDGASTWHGPFPARQVVGKLAAGASATLVPDLGSSTPLTRGGRPPGPPSLPGSTIRPFGAETGAVKLLVDTEGWYRITSADLQAIGFSAPDTRLLQLYSQGTELPILVGTSSAKTVPGAPGYSIEFYATGLDSPYSASRVYWLVSGQQPGKRIPIRKAAGSSGGAVSFDYTLDYRERSIYFAALLNGDAGNFFGRVVSSQPTTTVLGLAHVDRSATRPAVLEVALQGVTDLPGPADHRVEVRVNGVVIGGLQFDGREHPVEKFSFPGNLLTEGANTVILSSSNGPSDISLIDTLKVTFPHLYQADGDLLRCVASSGLQTIGGFTSRNVRVVDVTDPRSVEEIPGQVTAQKGAYGISVPVSGQARELLAFTDGQVRRPLSIELDRPSNLRQTQAGCDLLIVTRRDLMAALAPLAELRQKQGLSVEIVDIADVYDEFNYGEKSPAALRDFLAYAHKNWQKKPGYIVLAGAASNDPRNYLGQGDTDVVPTKLVDTSYLQTASDDWLVDFDQDGLPDVAIGRLPARTPQQATRLVSKLLRYEQGTSLPQALLVADLNDGVDFQAANREFASLLNGIEVTEIDRGRQSDDQSRRSVLAALNQGPRLISYVGHGAPDEWNGGILTATDASSMTNGEHLSVAVLMTCLNGYYDAGPPSLAEALLTASDGGAVAAWASTGMSGPAEQQKVATELYRVLFVAVPGGSRPVRLGDAIRLAKATAADPDVRRTWVLLGDPSMRLR